jgi:2'-5' RNA ligase
MNSLPLILTAKLDAESFSFFNSLREKHFPPERNFLKAHVTLFHHLPGEEISMIENDLRNVAANRQTFELRFPTLRFLGKGTAAEIESPELLTVRATLADSWKERLTAQDLQKFKPHITIQNKVALDEARRLFDQMSAVWKPVTGKAVGLQLWHYQGGPWELANEFPFADQ